MELKAKSACDGGKVVCEIARAREFGPSNANHVELVTRVDDDDVADGSNGSVSNGDRTIGDSQEKGGTDT
ncbi:hypothetical protein PI124_g9303 [Phytophthora idaei]|nr:hypothetical protein PI125_g22806 [Phytophthora idaei]KAG3142074.1 hypothetical protein PI126_g15214 [Phytophthora idaei]KAG3245964.1 hypothetical protein PI124_g9303 [Phytophthora idaei]